MARAGVADVDGRVGAVDALEDVRTGAGTSPDERWVVLLPVKNAAPAKSRLAPAFAHPADHAAVVRAMRTDTFAAITATDAVGAVVAVTDDHASELAALFDLAPDTPGTGTTVSLVPQRSSGLNGALTDADEVAAARYPGAPRIAVVGDLPALTPSALTAVLTRAGTHRRAFVPDRDGEGTTMLAVTSGPLAPAFGPGSAERHGRDAVRLDDWQGIPAAARHDVDVASDLDATPDAPFGARTDATLQRLGRTGSRPDADRSPAPGTIGACPTPT